MVKGSIRDYSENKDAAQRGTFRTNLFSSRTGSGVRSELRWGEEVEFERDDFESATDGRIEVSTSGDQGWVDRRHVVMHAFVNRYRDDGEWKYSLPLYRRETGNAKVCDLLWGDLVQVMIIKPGRCRVRSRGLYGWVSSSALDGESLLECYFVDVGQGDGVLLKTPAGRHMLIDGGYPRNRQPSNKNAADFVDWKFFEDYGDYRIRLDELVASHCDLDHYGGLNDLLSTSADAQADLDCAGVDVDAFYHAGVSWWDPSDQEIQDHGLTGDRRDRWLGPEDDGHLTRLLEGHQDIQDALPTGADPRLQGQWRQFLDKVAYHTTDVQRLGVDEDEVDQSHYLPHYGATEEVSVRVMGPVFRTRNNRPQLRDFGGESQNTNGHSIIFRVDYDHARFLFTGDLNKNSMQHIAGAYGTQMREFACDVAKACHHGSEDVSISFLQQVRAGATIISSGDTEGHAHPRSAIVAASGMTGHVEIDTTEDELITPLVYSTEVERSHRLGRVDRIEVSNAPDPGDRFNLFARHHEAFDGALETEAELRETNETGATIHYREATPSRFRAKRDSKSMRDAYVVTGLHYGLVNVRTNGDVIICATMKEMGGGWTVRSFNARF